MNKPKWSEEIPAIMNESGSLLIEARAQATLFAKADAEKVSEMFHAPIDPAVTSYMNAKET